MSEPDGAQHAPHSSQDRAARRRADAEYAQRNFASRLFPGPSQGMSRQRTEHIEGLLSPLGDGAQPTAWPGRQPGTRTRDGGARPTRTAREQPGAPDSAAPDSAAPDSAAQLRDTLDQQSELLRAILASLVDTQSDARSTAQNSRTFAWAGTAIALLTLIATIIAIIAAVR
jgi:hypothetical protein